MMPSAPDALGHDVIAGSVVMHRTPTASYWAVEHVSPGGRVAVVRNIHGRRALVAAGDLVVQQEISRESL